MHMDEHKHLEQKMQTQRAVFNILNCHANSVCVFVCLTLSVHPELW